MVDFGISGVLLAESDRWN